MVLPDIQIIKEDSLADGSNDRISPDDLLADLQKKLDMQAEAERARREAQITAMAVSYTHLTLPTNREV